MKRIFVPMIFSAIQFEHVVNTIRSRKYLVRYFAELQNGMYFILYEDPLGCPIEISIANIEREQTMGSDYVN